MFLFFVDSLLSNVGRNMIQHNLSGVYINYIFEKDKNYELFYKSSLSNPKVELYLITENKKELVSVFDNKISNQNKNCLKSLRMKPKSIFKKN